jgi:hypothetical protein
MKRTAQILLFVNVAIWVAFSTWTFIYLSSGSAEQNIGYLVVALLMLGNACAFLLAGLGLGKPSRLTWLFALAVLIVNILLTFTD